MQGISWKDVLHYGSAVGLVMLGGLAMMGLQIPGVTIDPTICFTTAAGIFAAGLKGGVRSGKTNLTAVKSLTFLIAAGAVLALAVPAHAAAKAKPSSAQAQANPLLVVQQFTGDDLNAAIADAKAQIRRIRSPSIATKRCCRSCKAASPIRCRRARAYFRRCRKPAMRKRCSPICSPRPDRSPVSTPPARRWCWRRRIRWCSRIYDRCGGGQDRADAAAGAAGPSVTQADADAAAPG